MTTQPCPGPINYQAVALPTPHHLAPSAAGLRQYADPHALGQPNRTYAYSIVTADPVTAGIEFTNLVATWHARTTERGWIEIEVRVRCGADATWSSWFVLARWAHHDRAIHPASVPGQADDIAHVDVDVVRTTAPADAWQLRVTVLWPSGEPAQRPAVSYLAAVVCAPEPCRGHPAAPVRAAQTARRSEQVLDVPPLSQRVHTRQLGRWGDGNGWCSPTSVAMVAGYWGHRPDHDALSWVDDSWPDRVVYHAVRHCWDYGYQGAGNWSFNAAYAAQLGLHSFITRMTGLDEARRFIDVGIPLVLSVQVDPARLSGAEYTSPGHLLTLIGFDGWGNAVVNDPAAADTSGVRRVYHRDELESAWHTGSGGLVYVIHPPTVELPPRGPEPHW